MNRIYENPEIEVTIFDIENIVTRSSTNEDIMRNQLVSGGVSGADVKTYTFDELISAE